MPEQIAPQSWMNLAPTRAVIAALEAAGGPESARFVGGCVRDALLGRPVADIDIATPLIPPDVVRALGAAGLKAVPTGIEHGTVTAISGRRPYEITTLRRDVETDGRRAVVAFTTDWAEDASRRDFRLNALYLDPQGRLYDPIGGGIEDAIAGRIVFVGEAEARIREDFLRVLRFFRFFAWYGRGEPDPAAVAACAALKEGVAGLSGERLAKELLKLMGAPDPLPAVRLMQETGVLAIVLTVPLDLERLEAMVALTPDPELRLAALLPDDPEAIRAVARRLRLANAQRERLVAAAGVEPALDLDEPRARRVLYRLGASTVRDRVLKRWAERPQAEAQARGLIRLADDWSRPLFPLTGADVMALGVERGPAVGRLLSAIEDWWLAQDFAPDREAVLDRLKAATEEQA